MEAARKKDGSVARHGENQGGGSSSGSRIEEDIQIECRTCKTRGECLRCPVCSCSDDSLHSTKNRRCMGCEATEYEEDQAAEDRRKRRRLAEDETSEIEADKIIKEHEYQEKSAADYWARQAREAEFIFEEQLRQEEDHRQRAYESKKRKSDRDHLERMCRVPD